jgi:hypothetical protein
MLYNGRRLTLKTHSEIEGPAPKALSATAARGACNAAIRAAAVAASALVRTVAAAASRAATDVFRFIITAALMLRFEAVATSAQSTYLEMASQARYRVHM